MENSLSLCKELLRLREWDSCSQAQWPSLPSGLCVMSVLSVESKVAPCLKCLLGNNSDNSLFVLIDSQQSEVFPRGAGGESSQSYHESSGSGIQGYKKWNPGLVLECALWTRWVTPSVLVSAAGIEGDWVLGGPELMGSEQRWCNEGTQLCNVANWPQPWSKAWRKWNGMESARMKRVREVRLVFDLQFPLKTLKIV